MAQKSLGLIETIGLTAAVEAADAAVKSANVTLVGYELSKGDGMTLIKVQGDVGAVTAAISAAAVAAGKVGRVVSTRVIARPADGLERLINTPSTVGITHPKPAPVASPPAQPPVSPVCTPEPEQVTPEQAVPESVSFENTPGSGEPEAETDAELHDAGSEEAPSDGSEKADSQKKRKKKK